MQNEIKIKTDTAIMPIGAISQALGIHQRTLRIYDAEGILCPKRTGKNRRCYSLDDLERAKVIMFLTRSLSINISGVKIILKMLEEAKVETGNYFEYVNKIASLAKIDTNTQKLNLEKNAKKGRKSKEINS